MKLKLFFYNLFFFIAISSTSLAQNTSRYLDVIQNFKTQDSLYAPQEKAILFVGSSTFTNWSTMQEAFPEHVVLNRGFGGSQLTDIKVYFQEHAYPKNIKQIVIYGGDNDIAVGNSPEEVLRRFTEVFDLIRKDFPKAQISFISIKSCPARTAFIPKVLEANFLVKDYLQSKKFTSYIDINSVTLTENGMPMPGIYLKDGIHMNQKGYVIWAKVIEPYLQ